MSTATKSKPILFSAPMVRAILDGRKTMTRRAVKPQPPSKESWVAVGVYSPIKCDKDGDEYPGDQVFGVYGDDWDVPCKFGMPGDQLWVRETFYIDDIDHLTGRLPKERPSELDDSQLYYAADGTCCKQIPECQCASVGKPKWRPSIFMPRWASRITLEITDVRAEKLGELTEADALAEGIKVCNPGTQFECYWDYRDNTSRSPAMFNARDSFCTLWESINGAWDESLWVWAISFRRITP